MVGSGFRRQMEQLGRRLRLGYVGGGEGSVIGATHRFGARLDGRYDIVAGAFDIEPARGRDFARGLFLDPARVYDGYGDLIRAEKARPDPVDLVGVLTPNHSHFEIARALIDAGFNVLCEKPMTTSTRDAVELADLARARGVILAVMYGYSGYPMARQARGMVAAGEIGRVRLIECEFASGNPATMSETAGGHWRTTPGIAGPAAVLGMTGTHAVHMTTFVSGLALEALSADLQTFVPGRKLEDNAHLLLRFAGGARGCIWNSYTAAGQEHGLRIRVFGETGGLEWDQEDANRLIHRVPGQGARVLTRGSGETLPEVRETLRVAIGHPEGFIEAFGNIYCDVADAITLKLTGADPSQIAYPGIDDGVAGVLFVDAAVESHRRGGAWVRTDSPALEPA